MADATQATTTAVTTPDPREPFGLRRRLHPWGREAATEGLNVAALVRAAQRGDREAYNALAEHHRRGLMAAIRTAVRTPQDAEDLTQVVLLQAWRDLRHLRAPERFAAWLHQIGRNRSRDFLRRRRPPSVSLDELEGQPEAREPADGRTDREVRDAIAALPEMYRTTAELFYLGGFSLDEAAHALSVPSGTVKRRLHDARRRLRNGLADPPPRNVGGDRRVLELEDLQSLVLPVTGLERVALSPDGRHVAYAVKTAGDGGEEIRVHDSESGEVQRITPGWGTSGAPRWSPDGTLLAFVSDRHGQPQLWVWERERGNARLVLEAPVVRHMWFEAPCWLPGGRHLVVKLRAPGWRPWQEPPGVAADAPLREVWTSPCPEPGETVSGPSWKDEYRGDLAVVDLASGSHRRLTEREYPLGVAVAPDGASVAAMFARSARPDTPAVVFDLDWLPVDGGAGRRLASGVSQAFGTEFSWSPDGRRIAYTTFGEGPGQLAVVSVDGTGRVLHDGSAVDLGNEEGVPPLWSPDGTTLHCWAGSAIHSVDAETGVVTTLPGPDGRSVYGIVHAIGGGVAPDFGRAGTVVVLTRNRETRQTGLWRLTPSGPEAVVPEADRNLVEGVLLGGDVRGARLAGFVEDLNQPGELHVFDGGPLFQERRVSRLNPAVPWAPATGHLMPWADASGRHRLAAVLLPGGAGPWPAVLRVYGGEAQASRIHEFACGDTAWNPLLLTARGYAVVLPDMDANGPDPADEIADQALRCLDAAVAHGYADPDRAAILGHSYGGYSALATITRTPRFRAAIVSGAISDLASFAFTIAGNELLWSGRVEGGLGAMHAAPWEAPERFIRNSPVYAVDRVQTPVLLFHGTQDGVPIAQSEAFYAGLRRLGRPAVLVRYRGQGHGIRSWSPETLADYWRRTLAWLDRYLGG